MNGPANRGWMAATATLLGAVLAACGGGGSEGPGSWTPLSTAPGTASGEAASGTIGPAGGTLASADGRLTLTIPAGAVTGDTVFTITPVTAPAENAVATYRLDPEGTPFAAPARLTFDTAGAGVDYPGLKFLAVAIHQADGTWRLLDDQAKDAAAKTLSVEVRHFSEYSMLSGYQLQPLATTAEVGGAAQFTVVACADPWMLAHLNGEDTSDIPVDGPPPLIFECKAAYFEGARAERWTVEGVEGGDATHGTIQPDGSLAAVFTAPSQKPDPATVSVTTRFHYSNYTTLQDLVVGRVTITDGEKYFGNFLVRAYGPLLWQEWTASGDARWKTGDYPDEYLVTGTIKPDQTSYPLGDATCTLVAAEQPFTCDSAQVQVTPGQATTYWLIPPTTWAARCCTHDGNCQDVQDFLTLIWASGCATEWASLDMAEYDAHGGLKGSYTWPSSPCNPSYPNMPWATVEWLFIPFGG